MTDAEKKILNIDYTTATPYIYTFVRRDIPIVQQIVQSSHACHHAGAKFGAPADCHMVLFSVHDEKSLMKVVQELGESKVDFHLFYEPDPIWGSEDLETPMGNSALCTRPLVGDARRIMEAYELWYEIAPI